MGRRLPFINLKKKEIFTMKPLIKKLVPMFSAVMVTFAIGAFLSPTMAQAKARVIKLAHQAPTNDPRHESLSQFAKMIEEKSGGELTVKIYPSATLGKDREVFEQLQGGLCEIGLNGGVVTNFYKQFSIINMPYLWRDQGAVREFLATDTGTGWVDDMAEKSKVRILAFYDRNPRILTTKPRAINKVEELKGLKVRVPRIETYLDTWRAFGVQPVPMPASEFYMGLKLGTIDGMENPIEVMYHWKIYEVSKNLSITNHMRQVLYLTASQKFLDSLTPEQRQVIQEAAIESAKLHNTKTEQSASELVDKLKAEGMTIVEPDLTGFKAAAQEVHDKHMDAFGKDVYEMVKAKYSK